MDVVGTDEFSSWYAALPEVRAESVTRAVNVLERLGLEQEQVAPVEMGYALARLGRAGDLRLFELAVPDCALRVLFALETVDRAVLLYGYDAETELNVGAPRRMPIAAHALLAANVYRLYRASRPGAA